MSMTPEQLQAWRWEREIDERNRPLSDEELDAMFPEGYRVSRWTQAITCRISMDLDDVFLNFNMPCSGTDLCFEYCLNVVNQDLTDVSSPFVVT